MDVRPGEYEDVEITCTITNTYQLPEEISFQIDEDNSTGDFSYDISPEGPYQLAAGEEQVVLVSVRGSQGMEADTSTYTVQMTATVDSVGTEPVVVPVGTLGSSDTKSSEVKIEWYHSYDFLLTMDVRNHSNQDRTLSSHSQSPKNPILRVQITIPSSSFMRQWTNLQPLSKILKKQGFH